VDLIGNEASLAILLQVMESCGFRRYARLLRLVRSSPPIQPVLAVSEFVIDRADAADCESLMELLNVSFDRFADQLPTFYEIQALVEKRQVLVFKNEKTLAAALVFETQGFTSTIRFWVVAEAFRAHGFGSGLIRHYFVSHPTVRRFILWVTAQNKNALQKYQHYGYSPDGLVDHVLVNEMIHP
jgi:ribosomal protein S18 acetylase RimI-like enzyme